MLKEKIRKAEAKRIKTKLEMEKVKRPKFKRNKNRKIRYGKEV